MIDLPPLGLTIEQQFQMRLYEEQVDQLPADQARLLLLQVMRQLIIQQNISRHLIKKGVM